ncbi:hypothetical protein [Silvibacterium acidisoli]|uniref:hypothetical protein n=1 Tax=Acidobacteriaceae bacterium ZG23-2 TaxID=2883246 RepID=UPI00406BE4B2
MDFFMVLVGGLIAYVGLILAVFVFQRAKWRRNKGLGKKRWGFYPSTTALGNAFQTLQLFAQPEVRYVLQEKETDDVEKDDEDDPEHPERYLNRQLRRIRNGEEVGVLKIRKGR